MCVTQEIADALALHKKSAPKSDVMDALRSCGAAHSNNTQVSGSS